MEETPVKDWRKGDGRSMTKDKLGERAAQNIRKQYAKYKALYEALEKPAPSDDDPDGKTKETVACKETVAGKETAQARYAVVDGEAIELVRSPNVLKDNWASLQPEPGSGITSRILEVSLATAAMPEIDLFDADAVEKRLIEFFDLHRRFDLKPTVNGMALALGLSRSGLSDIVVGSYGNRESRLQHVPESVRLCVKKFYVVMTNLWEGYMQSGQINPVSGIFLGKNHFGYSDRTELFIAQAHDENSVTDPKQLRSKYDSEQLAIDSDSYDSYDSPDYSDSTK